MDWKYCKDLALFTFLSCIFLNKKQTQKREVLSWTTFFHYFIISVYRQTLFGDTRADYPRRCNFLVYGITLFRRCFFLIYLFTSTCQVHYLQCNGKKPDSIGRLITRFILIKLLRSIQAFSITTVELQKNLNGFQRFFFYWKKKNQKKSGNVLIFLSNNLFIYCINF